MAAALDDKMPEVPDAAPCDDKREFGRPYFTADNIRREPPAANAIAKLYRVLVCGVDGVITRGPVGGGQPVAQPFGNGFDLQDLTPKQIDGLYCLVVVVPFLMVAAFAPEYALVCIGVCSIIDWCCGTRYRASGDNAGRYETETVRTDTIRSMQPRVVEYKRVGFEELRLPTVSVRWTHDGGADSTAATDDGARVTEHTPDSVTVELPITQSVWTDSTYTAYVSGYRARLDSIYIYRSTIERTVTISRQVKPKRWSIGLQAGYGATPKGLQPYIGIGVGYKIQL